MLGTVLTGPVCSPSFQLQSRLEIVAENRVLGVLGDFDGL